MLKASFGDTCSRKIQVSRSFSRVETGVKDPFTSYTGRSMCEDCVALVQGGCTCEKAFTGQMYLCVGQMYLEILHV